MNQEEAGLILEDIREVLKEHGLDGLDQVLIGQRTWEGDNGVETRTNVQLLEAYIDSLISHFKFISSDNVAEIMGRLNATLDGANQLQIESLYVEVTPEDQERLNLSGQRVELRGVPGLDEYIEELEVLKDAIIQNGNDPTPHNKP